jgi:GNAT superfamily N-acetyltransferase
MPPVLMRIDRLPADFEDLVAEAAGENFPALARMQEAWSAGTNRFDRCGEGLWIVREGERTVGLCGLNVDPYLADPDVPSDGVARLRHLYVRLAARRRGIGRCLVHRAADHARDRFQWIRLRTHDPVAARFYEALGFAPPPDRLRPDATHALDLSGPP